MDQELEAGLSDLSARLARAKLKIVDNRRPWPDRTATYLVIGNGERNTSIVLTDEFLSDLPATREYQVAVDEYATTLGTRIRCGPANLFYCKSDATIRVEVEWPVRAAVVRSRFQVDVLTNVTDARNETLARCAVALNRFGPYDGKTPFDEVRSVVNRIRIALDRGTLSFHKPKDHPIQYQRIAEDDVTDAPTSPPEIEKFIAGKSFWLGFRLPPVPGETWIADPWDANYLGVSVKDLAQQGFVVRARGLIDLDATLAYARPSDKLLTEGWPRAMESINPAEQLQRLSLASLPKKENMLADVTAALNQVSDLAVLVIDLDHFKDVNDTLGHLQGDACLESIVKVTGNILARRGTLYRWGGDEFAIVLPSASTQEAGATAERIRREIQQAKPGGTIPVTASIGVCALDQIAEHSAQALLDAADKAMYASKRNGKNRVTSWPIESAGESPSNC
jgi:diguanylate cyclase (GGDEF)-like protein